MYDPQFSISRSMAQKLVQIERLANQIQHTDISPSLLRGLRKTARIHTIHYSTYIEGNRLTVAEVQTVLADDKSIPDRTRDESEVRGYFAALNQVSDWAASKAEVSERNIQRLHALVMAGGKQTEGRTPYWLDQNAIREAESRSIIYMPPEPSDVPQLMSELCEWLTSDDSQLLPAPLVAGILHYQFVTIHPYLDGNGRTARLLTTWFMHRGGYDLGGIYSLEEHYAKNLAAYYAALALGPSHNYYFGRHEADISPWLEYFVDGILKSFQAVTTHLQRLPEAQGIRPVSQAVYFDERKRAVLERQPSFKFLKTSDLQLLFGIGPRAARDLAQKWVQEGFLAIENPSKKARLYRVIVDEK